MSGIRCSVGTTPGATQTLKSSNWNSFILYCQFNKILEFYQSHFSFKTFLKDKELKYNL